MATALRRPDQHFESDAQDRKSTRLNSSHLVISYAVFCLKKKIISKPPIGVNFSSPERAMPPTSSEARIFPPATRPTTQGPSLPGAYKTHTASTNTPDQL